MCMIATDTHAHHVNRNGKTRKFLLVAKIRLNSSETLSFNTMNTGLIRKFYIRKHLQVMFELYKIAHMYVYFKLSLNSTETLNWNLHLHSASVDKVLWNLVRETVAPISCGQRCHRLEQIPSLAGIAFVGRTSDFLLRVTDATSALMALQTLLC